MVINKNEWKIMLQHEKTLSLIFSLKYFLNRLKEINIWLKYKFGWIKQLSALYYFKSKGQLYQKVIPNSNKVSPINTSTWQNKSDVIPLAWLLLWPLILLSPSCTSQRVPKDCCQNKMLQSCNYHTRKGQGHYKGTYPLANISQYIHTYTV